jgi:hypothetical protein
MNVKHIQLQMRGDVSGMPVSLEGSKDVPFDIKRVYYLLKTKTDTHRGRAPRPEATGYRGARLGEIQPGRWL